MQLTMLNKNLYSFSINAAWLPDSAGGRGGVSEPHGQHTHPGWSSGLRLGCAQGAGWVGVRAQPTTHTGLVLRPQAREHPGFGAGGDPSPAGHRHAGRWSDRRLKDRALRAAAAASIAHVSHHRGSPAALPIPCCGLSGVAQPAALRTSPNQRSGKPRPQHCILAEGRPVPFRPVRGGGA